SAEVPELVQKVQTVLVRPCFALMMAFSQALTSIPVDGYTVTGSTILSCASCESRKPGRSNSGSECWVLHSTTEYADQIISKTSLKKPSDDILNVVKSDLFREFQKTAPDIPSPLFMKAHRWGSAFPTTIIAKDDKCLWVENKRVAVCGDFCVAPDVEGAILSGLAAASKLLQ
ncbi:hypothetical protein KI387_032586, partial [Taxus chinensis]